MFGKVEKEAKGKKCSMLSNLKSALRSDVFGKLKWSVRESLKRTSQPASQERICKATANFSVVCSALIYKKKEAVSPTLTPNFLLWRQLPYLPFSKLKVKIASLSEAAATMEILAKASFYCSGVFHFPEITSTFWFQEKSLKKGYPSFMNSGSHSLLLPSLTKIKIKSVTRKILLSSCSSCTDFCFPIYPLSITANKSY